MSETGDIHHSGRVENEFRIGPILESERRRRGLSLQEVEQATKIRTRYLEALEQDDFGALPDAVYVQGFVKTYANYLGLNGEELSHELKERRASRRERQISYSLPESRFEQPLISPGGLAEADRRRVSGPTVATVIAAIVILVAVIGALYLVGAGSRSASRAPDTPPMSAAQGTVSTDRNEGSTAAPGSQESTGNAGGTGQGSVSQPETGVLRATVRVSDSASWLDIVSDGAQVYTQVADPGFSQTFEATESLTITTGNAGSVTVEINGQNVGVLGEPGEVLTRNFNVKPPE